MDLCFRYFLIITCFFCQNVLALQDCRIQAHKAPPCPKTGSLVLDNSYPAAFAAISTEQGINFSTSFIEELMFQQNPPIPIVVTATKESFAQLILQLKKSNKLNEVQKKVLVEYLVPVYVDNVAATNWQQDFMEGHFNSETGLPEVKEVKNYFKERDLDTNYLKKIIAPIEKCGVTLSKVPLQLPAQDENTNPTSGMFGGNIEALPNGVCILGTDHFGTERYLDKYALNSCGRVNHLIVPTSFLKVGHVDEIISVLPDSTKPKPCNYAIALASPRKALDLLRENPDGKLFEASFLAGDTEAFQKACRNIIGKRILTKWDERKNSPTMPPKSNSVFHNLAPFFNLPKAEAKESEGFFSKIWNWKKECQNLTNNDLLQYIEGDEFTVGNEPIPSELKLANNSIQKQLDSFKNEMSIHLENQKTSCKPEIVDVPVLYEATYSSSSKKAFEAVSILPSPANGIRVNHKYLYSQVGSNAFEKYLQSVFRDKKAQASGIDTFWAHQNLGNLHCSSNIIRYCNPRVTDAD